jgi:predicted transcriptional regulator
MSSATGKDYFGSFLNAAQGDAAQTRGAPGGMPAEVEKKILSFLAPHETPTSVRELIVALALPPSLAVTALQQLAKADLVTLSAAEGDECVRLTDLGRRVAA